MKGDSIANVCVLAGVCLVSSAAWIAHPSAGLAVAGLAAIAIGIAIVRNQR